MTLTAITSARILASGTWLDGHAVIMSDDLVHAIVPASDIPVSAKLVSLNGGVLLPGFIDTQVNGGGGVLFNDVPSAKGIAAIAAAHRRFGTTAMLPTLISDDLDVVARAIAAVDDAIKSGVPGIIGIHIEGPFLNTAKRGIHDAGKFRTLDEGAVALLSSLKYGKTLVTLAPELAPVGAIAKLVKNGVVVAAGHTLANYAEMQRGIAEGLTGVTHLFNAMTQMESRAPGVVGAAFDSNIICGIIADGYHVDPATLRAAYRAKGMDEIMLVTDAMPTTGSNVTTFNIGGTAVKSENGKLESSSGTLAGSNLDMATAVRNASEMMRTGLAAASHMASYTPAAFIGLSQSHGRIAPGYRGDIVHLDDNLNVTACWIGGNSD
jgi:N-acetylglucosamine-6-phosphate deacetylase